MDGCIFCRIVEGKAAAKVVEQDDAAVAFEDIHPQSPVHILIVPRKHIGSLDEAAQVDADLLGRLLLMAQRLARLRKIVSGYRIVINNGIGAGQSVFHLHVHLLGGRYYRWPPG
jgi:histidine triad (HIT) family protein